MQKYTEIEGDLISLAKKRQFDVIAHGCNCFCIMGSGIAPQMAEAFGVDRYRKESNKYKGDINKLGTIDYQYFPVLKNGTPNSILVVNAYTQYDLAKGKGDVALDYEALRLCLRKMNFIFKGKHIGLPQIGCGLAGGSWRIVKAIIQEELKDCQVTVVIYNKS